MVGGKFCIEKCNFTIVFQSFVYYNSYLSMFRKKMAKIRVQRISIFYDCAGKIFGK